LALANADGAEDGAADHCRGNAPQSVCRADADIVRDSAAG